MTNEEYELLVYSIAYQTLLEEYQSYEGVEPISEEYLLEKKGLLAGLVEKGIKAGIKHMQTHDNNVEEYRRRADEIRRTTDPKEKKRLERQQQNFRIKKGVDDSSRTSAEHVADGAKAAVDTVKKGVKWLGDKVKQAHQNQQQKNQNQPIGLSSLNKQTT